MSDLGTTRDVLLLDGDCGLCHRLATFVDRRLRPDVDLAYRPILSADGEALIATFPEPIQALDTVYLVRNGVVHTRSAAAIRTLLYMRWWWRWLFPFAWLVPKPLRDVAYRTVAKHRHRFFAQPEVCTFRID